LTDPDWFIGQTSVKYFHQSFYKLSFFFFFSLKQFAGIDR